LRIANDPLILHNRRNVTDQPPSAPTSPPLTSRQRALKWLKFILRWGIAVVGIWLVVQQIYLNDRVWVIENDQLVAKRLWQAAPANPNEPQTFRVEDAKVKKPEGLPVVWDATANKPDLKSVKISAPGGKTIEVPLIGLDIRGDLNKARRPDRLFVIKPVYENGEPLIDPRSRSPITKGEWITRAEVAGGDYVVRVPYPRIETGLLSMIRQANGWLLILAVAIFPITFLVTSVRWDMLLRVLGINLSLSRAFVLNMVGAFYNSFMIGSTGGDILKAYYASKHTPHRTRAVLSVIVDRVVGLLALVLMGGVMASYQYFIAGPDDPAGHACGKIALVSAAILIAAALGFVMVGHARWRKATGLSFLLSRLPRQIQVQAAVQTMEMYAQRKGVVIGTLLMTLPVHITVVLSAMFAGQAFGLTISPLYYFVAVPVIVLVGAIPISPQGAGVMEYFAIILLNRQGATVSQAFALTMSIRMVQILWNLTGGIFVFRGGYHQPTAREQAELESDLPNSPNTVPAS